MYSDYDEFRRHFMKSKETILKTFIILSLTILLSIALYVLLKGWIGRHFHSIDTLRNYISSYGIWAPYTDSYPVIISNPSNLPKFYRVYCWCSFIRCCVRFFDKLYWDLCRFYYCILLSEIFWYPICYENAFHAKI